MKNILITLFILSFNQVAFASSKEFIDLSFNLQKANSKNNTLRIKLALGEEGTISKVEGAEVNKITVKAIKWKDDLYKLDVRLSDGDKLITNSEVIVKKNQEAILQDFDAEGNSDYKMIIKAKR